MCIPFLPDLTDALQVQGEQTCYFMQVICEAARKWLRSRAGRRIGVLYEFQANTTIRWCCTWNQRSSAQI